MPTALGALAALRKRASHDAARTWRLQGLPRRGGRRGRSAGGARAVEHNHAQIGMRSCRLVPAAQQSWGRACIGRERARAGGRTLRAAGSGSTLGRAGTAWPPAAPAATVPAAWLVPCGFAAPKEPPSRIDGGSEAGCCYPETLAVATSSRCTVSEANR